MDGAPQESHLVLDRGVGVESLLEKTQRTLDDGVVVAREIFHHAVEVGRTHEEEDAIGDGLCRGQGCAHVWWQGGVEHVLGIRCTFAACASMDKGSKSIGAGVPAPWRCGVAA